MYGISKSEYLIFCLIANFKHIKQSENKYTSFDDYQTIVNEMTSSQPSFSLLTNTFTFTNSVSLIMVCVGYIRSFNKSTL